MTRSPSTHVAGTVTDIFAHRFVVRTATGTILADLGPKGAEQADLRRGEEVELEGDMKPSELKVHRLVRKGGAAIDIEHKAKDRPEHDGSQPSADPARALDGARRQGFAILGEPRRKPKHFEILGRDQAGGLAELHVGLDGEIRKTRPVAADDAKWQSVIGAATG